MSNNNEADKYTPSDPRKLAIGDRVKLKGGVGPEMVINERRAEGMMHCVWWHKEDGCFHHVDLNSNALDYVGPREGEITPDFQFGGGQHGGLPEGAIGVVRGTGYVVLDPLTPVGTVLYPGPGNGLSKPRSVTAHTLRTAIRNGRQLIDRRADWATVHACFETLAGEVFAQTGVNN